MNLVLPFLCECNLFVGHKFLGQISFQICCSPYLLKFSIEIQCNSIILEKTRLKEICPYFEQENFEKLELSIIIDI